MPESELKAALKTMLNKRGAFWSMIPGGAYGKKGDPDMVVCYKGFYVAVEAKTPTGRQRPDQKLRQEQIEAAGGIYILARSMKQVVDVLDEIDARTSK